MLFTFSNSLKDWGRQWALGELSEQKTLMRERRSFEIQCLGILHQLLPR